METTVTERSTVIANVAKIDPRAARMLEAWDEGYKWAMNLKAGDEFLGSMGEAKKRGLDEDCASMFSSGGYSALKRIDIYIKWDTNILTKVEHF